MSKPYLRIRWENNATRRYYLCQLEYDLLDELLLTIVYGGINSASGQIKKCSVCSFAEAMRRIEKIMKARRQHGYQLIFQENTF